jgi:hypothetical protein
MRSMRAVWLAGWVNGPAARVGAVASFALLTALLVGPVARAHTGDPSIVTRIDAVAPALPGVTIEVRAGVAD